MSDYELTRGITPNPDLGPLPTNQESTHVATGNLGGAYLVSAGQNTSNLSAPQELEEF